MATEQEILLPAGFEFGDVTVQYADGSEERRTIVYAPVKFSKDMEINMPVDLVTGAIMNEKGAMPIGMAVTPEQLNQSQEALAWHLSQSS